MPQLATGGSRDTYQSEQNKLQRSLLERLIRLKTSPYPKARLLLLSTGLLTATESNSDEDSLYLEPRMSGQGRFKIPELPKKTMALKFFTVKTAASSNITRPQLLTGLK